MAQGTITISMRTEWQPEEPTGERCAFCGDACYLKQSRLMIALGEQPYEPSGLVLCGACKDDG